MSDILDVGFFLSPGSYLNTMNDVNMGGTPGLAGVTGRVGAVKYFQDFEVARLCDTSVSAVLRQGWYMIVQAKATSTTAPARGGLCRFSTFGSSGYIVTPDFALTDEGKPVGVYCSTPTKGNYCVIQIGGLARPLARATLTAKVDGGLAIQLTTTNTVDGIAEATGSYISGGALGIKNIFGTFEGAPTDAVTNLCWMHNKFGFI